MGDEISANSKLNSQISYSVVDDLERKMLLLEIEKNEKSSFDDVITGPSSDNGWEDCLKETEDSVRSQWLTEELSTFVTVPPAILQENVLMSGGPQSYYELAAGGFEL